jgi:hypothetical protein
MTVSAHVIAALTIVSLGASTPALAQVRDRRDTAAPAPGGTASVSGAVVSDEDGHPLAMANVVIVGTLTGTLKVTTTDRSGRFVFSKLPADRYTVGASRPPYVGAVAGAKRAARPGSLIPVVNGQTVSNVTIRLFKGAVVAGTIFDERGLPALNATVTLMQWKMDGDERVLVVPPNSASTATDDAGRYRIFGVPPGEYVLSVMRTTFGPAPKALSDVEVDLALSGRLVDISSDPSLRAVPFYYPGTPRPNDATPLLLASGEERAGVDVRVEFVRTSRVEGSVNLESGELAPPGTMAQLVINAGGYLTMMSSRIEDNGRFTFPQAVPGPSVVSVELRSLPGNPAAAYTATVPIDTIAGDVLGIQLVLRKPMTLAARIFFEGASTADLAGRRVPVRALGRRNNFNQGVSSTNASADGAFTFTNVTPGRYLFGGPFAGPGDDSVKWTVKSIMADGADITDRPYEVKGDAPPKLISVTYMDQWQQLSGTLTHASGAASSDETVIVFPADRALWYQGSRRIAITRPAADGVFSFGGPGVTSLPPGEYLMAAVVDLGRDEQFDPSFLAALVPAAARITIAPGEKKTQDLVIR